MELVKVRGNTHYIPNKTNIGVIKYDNEVVLIDSGNDKDFGRKIRQILDQENLKLKYILNTHSNADHIGANAYLMNQYSCSCYSYGKEIIFSKYPELESAFLYGGYPTKAMQNKFLMAKPCEMSNINDLDTDIEYFEVAGHFFDMIAFKTDDNVYFLGDSLFPQDIIEKYHLFYILDIKKYLETLDLLAKINEEEDVIFIPSHGILSSDIASLIELNRNKIIEVIKLLKELCLSKNSFDSLLKAVFDNYHLQLDLNQYLLVGSTIRNYLSYLVESNEIEFIIEDNILYYQTKNNAL